VNGTRINLLLDLAGQQTVLSKSAAERLNLPRADLPRARKTYFQNRLLRNGAKVASLALEDSSGHDMLIAVADSILSDDPTVGGQLGMDLLHDFDVELDPANHMLNLYSREHCPGRVVYWTKDYVTLPFIVKRSIVRTTMELDGKAINVGINTVRANSYLPLSVSRSRLKVDRSTEGLSPLDNGVVLWGKRVPAFRYPFSELATGGLSIKNPQITIYDDDGTARVWNGVIDTECNNKPQFLSMTSEEGLVCGVDLYLGMNELRRVHSYFAFGEGALYVTALDAH
jgi:hypothetical protein